MIRKNIIKKRKNLGNKLAVSVLALLLLMIMIFLVFSNLEIGERKKELDQRIANLNQKADFLRERNEQLKSGVSRASNPGHIEELLREKGLYKKKGEKMIVIISSDEEENEEKEEERSIWEKFLERISRRD